jgi:hypothetical protein
MKNNEAKRDQRNVNVNTIYEMKAERKIRDMKQKRCRDNQQNDNQHNGNHYNVKKTCCPE